MSNFDLCDLKQTTTSKHLTSLQEKGKSLATSCKTATSSGQHFMALVCISCLGCEAVKRCGQLKLRPALTFRAKASPRSMRNGPASSLAPSWPRAGPTKVVCILRGFQITFGGFPSNHSESRRPQRRNLTGDASLDVARRPAFERSTKLALAGPKFLTCPGTRK